MVKNFIIDDRGADLIEYALLAGLIGVAAVLTLTNVGANLSRIYTAVNTKLTGVAP